MNKQSVTKINIEKIWFEILLASLFFFGLFYTVISFEDLLVFSAIIMPITLAGLLIYRRFDFDLKLLFLTEAMLLVAVHNYRWYVDYEVAYGWIIPLAYILGVLAVGRDKKSADAKITQAYFALILGMVALGFIDVVYNNTIGYFSTENLYRFWDNDIYVRTTLELDFILFTAGFTFIVFIVRKVKLLIPYCIVEALIFEITLKRQGRYDLFIIILQIPLAFAILIYDRWPQLSQKIKRILGCGLLTVAAIAIIAIAVFKADIGGIQTAYENSFLSGSGGILHNVRFTAMKQAILAIPDYLLGGYDVMTCVAGYHEDTPVSAHNTWLEYGNGYGVVVLALLLIYKLLTIIDAIRLFLDRKAGNIKYLLIMAFIFINIYYSLEPNAYANRLYLMIGLFVSGLIRGKLNLSIETEAKYKARQITTPAIKYDTAGIVLAQALIIAAFLHLFIYGQIKMINLAGPVLAYFIGSTITVFVCKRIGKDKKHFPLLISFATITATATSFIASIFYKSHSLNTSLIDALKDSYHNSFIYAYFYMGNFRKANFIEGIKLTFMQPRGLFTITSNGTNTSFNMWIDYARDYGIVVFIPLMIFLIITIYNQIRLLSSKEIELLDKIVLMAIYLAFNAYYMVEYTARNDVFLWMMGLFVCGVVKGCLISSEEQNSCEILNLAHQI